MPYKHNEPSKHHFKKSKYKITNWSDYTESLRRRGDITVWLTEEAIAQWHPEKSGERGRPLAYSDVAIECCLLLRQVYHLPLRQTQGLTRSLISLMDLAIHEPDYTTLSKRCVSLTLKRLIDSIEPGSHVIVDSTGLKVYGRDEWHQEKHDVKAKRTWRKLHLGIDENHYIVACELTENSVGDSSAVDDLLNQIDDFSVFMGDGAYDGEPVYNSLLNKNLTASIIIPPPKNAVEGNSSIAQRNDHVHFIKTWGRMAWQKMTEYGLRAYAELAMLRYKTIIGPKLKARKIDQQKTEAQVSARVLNKMTGLGMPISIKVS